ncbi:protein FAR1-RELATED SEQUENCE 5-like [Silene latifolia]|uniref:protein FAR1-RELATED SEQUENCE 5-like n=1 Tax=Silene latifolia TaxID=37657 RepID=UPI003D76E2EB
MGFAAHSSQLSYYSNYFLYSGFPAQNLCVFNHHCDVCFQSHVRYTFDPTSNVTSSTCNDLHVSAITSKDSNDIVESSITSTVLIEPSDASSSTPHLFGTLEEAISFYDVYAEACSFEPRKSSQKRYVSGDVKYKFVVCNREGFRDRKRNATVLDSGKERATPRPFDIRNTKLTRIGCTAMIEFRYNGDGYVVFQFREWHNHRLCSLRNQQFQNKHRHLHLYHKKAIIDHSRFNQGPTKAFRNVKEYVDGYENVGAQLVDFKNFGRDIKCFIGDWDAQLFVNYFEDKRDTTEGFYFAYESLVETMHALFGDYITYDPTYSTNKYCMLFTPFTGVDHHKRSVTFASTLLFHEDEDSFTWVFQKFLDAMGQREPHCIITDRCLWNKAGFASLSSNMLSADIAYGISCKSFDKVGLKRRKWIPAYFRDVPMGCLLRTTQRSESQNNFFKHFENAHGTLVEFLMRFQSAIDVQRHTQKQLDRVDDCTLLELATSLKLEAHASKVYTNAAFADFQVEASASICSLSVGGFTPPANSLFNRKGIICRHIIWVYSGKQVHTLTDKYILMRWTKIAHKIPLYGPHGELIEDFDATDLRKMEMCKLWTEFYATISMLKNVSTKDITD